ncbi:hypothetical protein TNCV_4470941 [Trichonephila clavipes]|uniref:Uncharacterized protein n=1 Tax=Trichonephila clavipes TaxID=2585209 RepID=A0A8X6VKJ5_TRICX|nr:hypothetical protein TNCV_4470941 [Trichonephila clavipes]
MSPLCMIVGNSVQEMVLPQESRVPASHEALLRGKTAVLSLRLWSIVLPITVCDTCGVKPELIGGRSGDLVPVMGVCWSEGERLQSNCQLPGNAGPAPVVKVWGGALVPHKFKDKIPYFFIYKLL